MWKKFKQLFNKDNFDYSTGDVNALEFHSIVKFLTKSYGVLDEPIPSWSKPLQIFMACCPIPALIICALGIYHGTQISDAAVVIEGGTYIIIMVYKLLILSSIKLNTRNYHEVIYLLRADFKYACTEGSRYRERFFKNQLETWKICVTVVVIMTIMTIAMAAAAVLALLYYLITHNPENGGQRPLLFPFWIFDVDFNKSPTYELAFAYSEICVFAFGYNYIFMIATQILWIREIACSADLVIWRIQDLLEDIHPASNQQERQMYQNIIQHRMRPIIQQHHSMYAFIDSYAQIYKKLLMYEQIFGGPVVCLTAYSAVEKLEDGELNYVLIILCTGAVVVTFMPSYMCTFLRIKVNSVLEACWDTPFWNAGPVIRPYLVLMIQRSLRPLPLSPKGLQEVSVQTFASKMTSAYSCFNMLRQAFK